MLLHNNTSVNFVYVSEKLIDYVQFGGQIVGIYVN